MNTAADKIVDIEIKLMTKEQELAKIKSDLEDILNILGAKK